MIHFLPLPCTRQQPGPGILILSHAYSRAASNYVDIVNMRGTERMRMRVISRDKDPVAGSSVISDTHFFVFRPFPHCLQLKPTLSISHRCSQQLPRQQDTGAGPGEGQLSSFHSCPTAHRSPVTLPLSHSLSLTMNTAFPQTTDPDSL